MAPGGHRRRQTLGQGLDREVYQIVRKIADEQAQFEDKPSKLSTHAIYDTIKTSSSSLGRKPRKLLEDSIRRVLDTIQQDAVDSDSDEIDVDLDGLAEASIENKASSNGLNKSIVGRWTMTSNPSERGTSIPKRDADAEPREKSLPAAESDILQTTNKTKRLTNGEPPQKKRRGPPGPSIDKSPPTHISLADMGGIDDVIQQFEDLLILPMKRPEVFTSSKVQPPRGILIHGPPGCGKTMIANAVAAEMGVSFISISAPSIVSGMSGESEKALREHFEEARKSAPCLIFIDEIDAITPKRESAQREMEKRIVAQLLTCMDDLALDKTEGKSVIVLAATNRPDSLDPALRRGGRFDKEINMSVPGEAVREQILRALTREATLDNDIDFANLAKRTPGFVGADLNDLVSTAGSAAIKRYLTTLKSESEFNTMEIDTSSSSSQPTPISSKLLSFRRLIKYTDDHPHLEPPPMSSLPTSSTDPTRPIMSITYNDFLNALPKIQPSALREGFATIPSTTFSSIGALQKHITELTSTIISPILSPEIYSQIGIHPSSGTLLWGPPGCGKTLLAKAVANASRANFISVKGPELLNKYVGESERAVRQVFTRARSSIPVVIFFDELDALSPRRDGSSMSEASSRVVNTLLTELDGVNNVPAGQKSGGGREGIYIIAATNRPDIIDPAMLRPGRLETLLYVGLPDAEGRVDVLRTLCKRLPHDFVFTEQMADVARKCVGFSGADLESLLRRAGYAAVKRVGLNLMPGDTTVTSDGKEKDIRITEEDFRFAMTEVRPSVGSDDLKRYERLQREWR